MSELQLGLLGIGVLVVLGVLAYNKLQEARLKRQAEEVFGSKHDDVLLGGKSGDTASRRPAGSTERIEPTLSAAPAEPAEASQPAACESNCAHHRPVRLSWVRLLKRVFELDLEHCPNGGLRSGNSESRPTAVGRERQFATFGCSRSPRILSRSPLATRERPLSPNADLLGDVCERPFPMWTGRSAKKCPRTALGREEPVALRTSLRQS